METIKTGIKFLFCSQSRISWRRITVFASASALLMLQQIDSTAWVTIALAYIAGDSAEKALASLRK